MKLFWRQSSQRQHPLQLSVWAFGGTLQASRFLWVPPFPWHSPLPILRGGFDMMGMSGQAPATLRGRLRDNR